MSLLVLVLVFAGLPEPPEGSTSTTLCSSLCRDAIAVQGVSNGGVRGLKARVVGAALGFAVGRAMRVRPEGAISLSGWRNADAAVLGSAAAAEFVVPRIWHHKEPDLARGTMSDCRGLPPSASALNWLDRAARRAVVAGDPAPRVDDPEALRHALDRRRLWDNLSDVTLGATLGLGLGTSHSRIERDMLTLAETVGATMVVTDRIKHLLHRPRPFLQHCQAASPEEFCEPDAQLSFFSGHSATAFAAAVAVGRIAGFRGSRDEARIWATGLTLATATGVLRVAADKHHATDVLVGAAVGSLAGWYIPKLHKPKTRGPTDHAASRSNPASAPAVTSLPLAFGRRRGVVVVGAGLLPGGGAISLRAAW